MSKSFSGMFKETSLAYFFDIGGIFAGLLIASQLEVFQLSPWAIALYPAVVSAKGVIGGLLSGRLGTALHLGTIFPRFFKNTKSFYELLQAMVVITLVTSVAMSCVSLVFGYAFWGITFAEFPSILSVVVATMALGLIITLLTIKVAFISFSRGLDPDIVVYPIMSTTADIIITLFYIAVLNIFFFGFLGSWVIAAIALVHVFLAFYILPRNLRQLEFVKTIRESMFTLLFVAFIVNVTGTVLKGISTFVENRKEVYTVYPALIDMVGDVGSVVGSTATTKLALGLLSPSFYSMRYHAKNIFSAWAASIMMFIILAFLSLTMLGTFSLSSFLSLLLILLVANAIAVAAITVVSYAVSILTFSKGLDPDNFVIPLESSLADSLTTIALLIALLITGAVA
ncbi:MAG: magnesium transporter [Candidatus Bathyarchaeota archaeon]|nr:magnesium transporter [Candidatus Bathyarchaeota archaeon]